MLPCFHLRSDILDSWTTVARQLPGNYLHTLRGSPLLKNKCHVYNNTHINVIQFFSWHQSFFWGHWYPCFGLLMGSVPGFKGRMDPLNCMLNHLCSVDSSDSPDLHTCTCTIIGGAWVRDPHSVWHNRRSTDWTMRTRLLFKILYTVADPETGWGPRI